MGNTDKILEKLLRGESDANIRFEELCHLFQAKGFRIASPAVIIFSRGPVSWSESTFNAKDPKPSRTRFDKRGEFWQPTNSDEA